MKTKDFILKKANQVMSGESPKSGWCSSVYFEGGALPTFFSYGRHYVLAYYLRGTWVINDTGYSRTTTRHISYCRSLEPNIRVPLGAYSHSMDDATMATRITETILKRDRSKKYKDMYQKDLDDLMLFRDIFYNLKSLPY